jgi:pyruvate formate lyase activating enzyme
VHIKALQQASVIEYPDHIADVVYVGACNFRCPYCYNVDLVLRPQELPDLDPDELINGLQSRRGFVDGLVVTGGEPTLQRDLTAFLASVKDLGLAVKLDTNGYRPEVLQRCLEGSLVDYVAMDVKTSLARYALAAGVCVERERLTRSISLLLESAIDCEFRTTVASDLVEVADIQAILSMISGAKRFYLQAFRPGPTVGWGEAGPARAPRPEVLEDMAAMAAPKVGVVGIRGLGVHATKVGAT